jgi:hypothetical protein
MRARELLGVGAAFLGFLSACDRSLEEPKPLPPLDQAYFRCKVQPLLTKSCSAFACHGDARRFFRVFARNRLRAAGTEKDRNAPLSELERASNYDAARAFVDDGARDQSLLLVKPLEIGAGGRFHRGADIFGSGNVFATREDSDFKTLQTWTLGATEGPTCVEPGSDQ